MNKLSILFLAIFSNGLLAQQKETIVQELDKRNKEAKCYSISYSRNFIAGSDTSTELIHSVLSVKKGQVYTGYHEITDQRDPLKKLLVAANADELLIMNCMDSVYRKVRQDFNDPYLLGKEKSRYLFPPLYRNRDEFMKYELKGSDSNYIYLQQNVELQDELTGEIKAYSTLVIINAKTYLPEKEERRIYLYGELLSSMTYSIHSFTRYDKSMEVKIKSRTDTLMWEIKKNGQAGGLSGKPVYKTVKKGDKAYLFSEHIHGTGDTFRLSDAKDGIVILDFFYTTCGPCAASIPDLLKIQKEYEGKGVKLIGFDPIQSDWRNLDRFISYFDIDYTIIEGTKVTSREYGVDGYPKLFIIKNGIIVKIYDGFENGLAKELEKELNKLLKE